MFLTAPRGERVKKNMLLLPSGHRSDTPVLVLQCAGPEVHEKVMDSCRLQWLEVFWNSLSKVLGVFVGQLRS